MSYQTVEPERADIDTLRGPALLEFGSASCGWCRAAAPRIAAALAGHPQLRHIRIADASGRALGRSFGVTLWPTLVFLRDGKEAARLVRPGDAAEIVHALSQIDR